MVITFADSAQVVSNYTGDRRAAGAADRRDRADAGDDLAPRGAPGRRGPGQSVEADRRRGRRLVGRHAQAVHLHRRRLRRRRGLQPGQPRARGRRDRPAAAPLFAAAPRAQPAPTPRPRSATPRTTWRSWRFRPGATRTSPTSTSSSAGSTTSAPRRSPPRPSSTATSADKPGEEGDAGRRDRAQAPAPERPVVQVRPARHRAGRPRGAADGQGRARRRQPRLHGRRHHPQGPGAGDHRRATATWPTRSRRRPPPSAPTSRSSRPRKPRARPSPATSRAAGTTWSSTTASSPTRLPRPMRSTSASFRPARPTPSPRRSQQPVILDWDIAHPLMQYIRDLSLVYRRQGERRRAARRAPRA